MSGVFDGSSFLSTAVDVTAGATVAAFAAWVKTTSQFANQAVLSVSDASASLDFLSLLLRGDLTGDPVGLWSYRSSQQHYANTSSSYTTGTWLHVAAIATDNGAGKVWLNGGGVDVDASGAFPINRDTTSIGRTVRTSYTYDFLGNIAEPAIWADPDAAAFEAALPRLASGFRPVHVLSLRDELVMYQSLLSGANTAEAIGPALTNTGVTFNAGDHPTLVYPPEWAMGA